MTLALKEGGILVCREAGWKEVKREGISRQRDAELSDFAESILSIFGGLSSKSVCLEWRLKVRVQWMGTGKSGVKYF